ncbi:MAG: DUF2284 domain-containing protein [Oscillospiraceae bacterium]|nr:DUF2284 domain-containing protein [Oscillospiraceae bacterium]
MPDINQIIDIAKECGFTAAAELNVEKLKFFPEVRDMCAADKCHAYDKKWVCPPGCGTLEECEARIRAYKNGVIVQTMGELEDEFDFETMGDLMKNHAESFKVFVKKIRPLFPKILPVSAGDCSHCESCTYPDAPCRFPDIATSPMEANGLLVSQVCEDNGIKYYYGKNTLAYTSCCMFDLD